MDEDLLFLLVETCMGLGESLVQLMVLDPFTSIISGHTFFFLSPLAILSVYI